MPRFAVALGISAALALAGELAAQRAPARTGFWYSVALGAGWSRVSCHICQRDHRPGLSAHVRLGGGVSRDLLVGAELAGWRSADSVDQNRVVQTLVALSGAAYWYPSRRGPLYLKGGVGFLMHQAEDGTNVIRSTGLGPQLGMGYELRVGRSWFLAPYFNAAYGSLAGGVKFNGAEVSSQATITLVQLGVALTKQ